MSEEDVIGPLRVQRAADQLVFRFVDSGEMLLEIPRALQDEIRAMVTRHADRVSGSTVVVDLTGIATFTSRQLGILLLLREAFKPYGKIVLHHVSDSVRHLLAVAKVDQLFELPA